MVDKTIQWEFTVAAKPTVYAEQRHGLGWATPMTRDHRRPR